MAMLPVRFLSRCRSVNLFHEQARCSAVTFLQGRRYSGVGQRSKELKQMLTSNNLEYLMEAHNGLSAKIVQEAGFKGVWASGLAMSAQMGVRDSNEASWTQVLDILEFMTDACDIPVLVDADTGYGNFNNARRLVRKLEERGVAGACLEDKLFPKTNSLHDGRSQPLADVEEFALKIKACKDHMRDPNFCIVARVEAFIAGWELDEAMRRAEAYLEAGADAILMHSKRKDPSQIESFMKAWNNKGPVVLVPTTYYTTPTEQFRNMGVSTIIWANHNIRASVKAMQELSKQIHQEQSLVGIEKDGKVVPVKEIFRLQNDQELVQAEDKYLPER
ncbi:phosphoenolpyruvate phosphomutase-like [Haliotis cracherodii]|uniref:phosphoenolpyruvate phosphomutase-like n=1 Tax=Haliotis cracherodii TaxID=6455 RepID=UPI0039ED54A3